MLAGALLGASSTMAAITPTSDDFSSDTSGSWVSVGATNTVIGYDGTSAGDYDDGDPATKLAYTVGMTLTGDGVKDDGGLRLDTVDAIPGNEAIGLTIAGTMDEGALISFTGSAYNDNGSSSEYIAQLWNLTDDTLLAETASINVNGITGVNYVPKDFGVAYQVKAEDAGDTLQIRFKEDNNNTARDVYVDNFSVTVEPETLYAYEGFDGVMGARVDLTGATGSGFTVTNTNFRMIYRTGLEYTDDLGNTLITSGQSAGMTNVVGGTQNLQLALDALSSGTVYASYLLKLDAGSSWGLKTGLQTAPVGNSADPLSSLAAGFRSTSSNFGAWSAPGGIDKRTGPSSNPYAITNVLVILEANLETDTLTVWLNPTNLNNIADSATHTMSGTGSGIGSLSSVVLSLGGQAAIDEIRVGNTLNVVLPLVDPSVQTLKWNFNDDSGTLSANTPTYDYTSDTAPYVGSNAVANTLAMNGLSSGSDFIIANKGTGHEKCLYLQALNPQGNNAGIYLQKLDFRVDNMNLTNKTRVSWSFDILGTDHAGIVPSNWTVRVNYGNYSENINVSDAWFNNDSSALAQTFDFVDDNATWTTVTGSYEIAVNQAGSAGGIQIRQPNGVGAYTSGDGVCIDNIEITIESIEMFYDSALEAWAAGFGLFGDDALPGTDYEPDGLDNLMEYALGGNPTEDDAATVAPATYADTGWFYHVYDERTDDPALTFSLGSDSDLVSVPAWDTNDVFQVGETAETNGFKTVTNRTEMTTNAKFIRLEVQQD